MLSPSLSLTFSSIIFRCFARASAAFDVRSAPIWQAFCASMQTESELVSRRVGGVPEAVEHGYTSRVSRSHGAASRNRDTRLSSELGVEEGLPSSYATYGH